jgi:hypothetical protein
MKFKSTFSSLVSSALFVLIASISAQASPITVNYYTTGAFTGCDAIGGGANFVTCTEGNTILQYNFNGSAGSQATANLTDAFPSASVQYGSFQASGDAVGAGDTFSGVLFTLSLFQTNPTVGTRALLGAVTGTVDAQSGGLLWGPVAPSSWDIGAIHWTIALDPTIASIRIDPPGLGGAAGLSVAIGGTARMDPSAAVPVPEPSTFALLGLGLAAVNRARRRRRATIA